MNVWITQADVIEILEDMGIDATSWEINSYQKLNKLIIRVQREFERLTRRKFERDTITEKIDGTGKDRIVLRYFPIISITSIVVEDIPGFPYTITLSEYRTQDETGIVQLISTQPFLIAYFPLGHLNVTATYEYGYDVINMPEEIKDCIMYMAVFGVIMRTPADWEKLGLKSLRIAQYAESYGSTSGVKGKSTTLSGIYGPQKEEWARKIGETIARYKRIPVV